MFNRPEVTTSMTGIDEQVRTLAQATTLMQEYVDLVMLPRSQKRTDASINTALGAHRRPTDWQTPKQRRWWWAVGVFLWHGRKKLQDWRVQHRRQNNGGGINAINEMPGARYVFTPPFQQRMHVGVWLASPTYAKNEAELLSDDLQRGWRQIAAGRGAVRILR